MRGFGYCYRRGRVWWIQFWSKGERRRESAKSEKEKDAKDLLKHRLAAEQENTKTISTLLIRDLYAELERDYLMHKRKSLRNIRQAWKNHLESSFAAMAASALLPDHVTIYVVARQKQGAKNATINRETACLKRMYKLAKIQGKLQESPYIVTLGEDNVRLGLLSPAQYEIIANESGKIGLWFRALFETAYTHGQRRTALLTMRVHQVNLLRQTISMDPGAGTKRKPSKIVMTGAVCELLRQCCAGKGPNDLVFTREREANGRKPKTGDGRISDFRADWKKVTAAAGCPTLLFHDLRRTALTNMIEDGIDEKTAMTIAGQKTRSVFDRYHIVKEAGLREAAAKVERGARQRRERGLFEQGEMFPPNSHTTATAKPN